MLKETILGSFKNKIAGAILKKDLDAFSKKMDYSNMVVQYFFRFRWNCCKGTW